jgi:hypothetical protein
MSTKRRTTALLSLMMALALIASACGSDSATAPDADDGTATAAPSATPTEEATGTPEAPPPTSSTTTTTTTEPPPTGPEPLAADAIPDLVTAWGAGTGDPLELAQEIIAVPIPVPMPEATTPLGISLDLFADDAAAVWRWEWTYEVLSLDPMPAIDIEMDETGPGAIALGERYDPIMDDLGWRRVGTTGSDPSSGAGGPQAVNHVYKNDSATIIANGLVATPKPIFVWADEEQVFGGGVPGFRIDQSLEFEPGAIPVPLIQTIVDALPEIAGARLVDVELDSRDRPDTSFDAKYGLRYIDISIEFALPAGSEEAAKTAFSTGLDQSTFMAGSESFFDEGFFDPEEPTDSGTEWTQNIVFLERYEGRITISTDAEGTSTVKITLRLEPERVVLQSPPAE